jgi:hypothetical protein
LLWLLLLSTPNRGRAQVVIALLFGEKLSTEKFQLGINASFAASGFMGISNKILPGWSLSIYGEIRFSKHFRLQPELALKYPGGARQMSTDVPGYSFTSFGEPELDDVVEHGKVERSMRYLALPVYAKWILGPVGLGVGPQLGVMLTADDTVAQKDGKTKISLDRSVSHEIMRVDAGVALSADYAFSPQRELRSLRLRIKSYLGLVDTVRHGGGPAMRNWNLMVGLDIPIGGSSKPKPKPEQTAPPT